MEHHFLSPLECCPSPLQLGEVPDLSYSAYGDESDKSSPSPSVLYSNVMPFECNLYSSSYGTPQPADPRAAMSSIEFMDLTSPQHEDRRRRRSTTGRDKEAISNMRTRRRAQNRASQRAFRERKEKHVQQLEQQLAELESRNQHLTQSYADLGYAHQKLKREVNLLRSELEVLHSKDGPAAEPGASSLFDPFASEEFFEVAPDAAF